MQTNRTSGPFLKSVLLCAATAGFSTARAYTLEAVIPAGDFALEGGGTILGAFVYPPLPDGAVIDRVNLSSAMFSYDAEVGVPFALVWSIDGVPVLSLPLNPPVGKEEDGTFFIGSNLGDEIFDELGDGEAVLSIICGTPESHPGPCPETYALVEGDVWRLVIDYTPPPIREVRIDIRPGEFPNNINTRSRGQVPVAILSEIDFSAPDVVDRDSLTFGRSGDENSLVRCDGSGSDVNGDGWPDLVCRFSVPEMGFVPDDVQGVLRGRTLDGLAIFGRDSVRIVR